MLVLFLGLGLAASMRLAAAAGARPSSGVEKRPSNPPPPPFADVSGRPEGSGGSAGRAAA